MWRCRFNVILAAFMVSSVLFPLIAPQPVYAQAGWYSADWSFRKSVTVVNPSADYQTLIRVYYVSGTDISFDAREPDGTGNYTAAAGTGATTIIGQAAVGLSTADDYYNGCLVYNITTALWGTVSDYVGATRTITCSTIAGQVAGDGFYLTNIPAAVYLGSTSQTDFDDIRFTGSDGVTLLDFWIESQVDSDVAWVWIENDSIPSATCYIYYGNASAAYPYLATEYAHGAATFIVFDDFERGASGDEVGGDWTEIAGTVEISTEHDIGDGDGVITGYGTRSMKVLGTAAANSAIRISVIASDYIAIRYRIYKEDLTLANFGHGNGTHRLRVAYQVDEDIVYFDGGVWADTGTNCVPDTWDIAEKGDFDWSGFSFDIYWADSGIAPTLIQNNADLFAGAGDTNLASFHADAFAGNDFYIDNFIVRKWLDPEPTWGSWGIVETWDYPALNVQDAKVYSGYLKTDDWIIVLRYNNFYPPYYDGDDVRQRFVVQLADSGTVLAQVSCPAWGYKPAGIYISAGDAASLEWGRDYDVRIYGNVVGNPYMEYSLQGEDWRGTDLLGLDRWCLTTAHLMEEYYGVTLTAYVGAKGEVLNEEGGVVFDNGIAGLPYVRPDLFLVMMATTPYTEEAGVITYAPAWQTVMGTYFTEAFTNMGNALGGIGGKAYGGFLFFGFAALIGLTGVARGHAMMGVIIVLAWLPFGTWLGLIFPAVLAVAVAIGALMLVWQVWFKGA